MGTDSVRSVVIVGAGHAGSEAAAALRDAGYAGQVTLVGEEEALPYQRPPLSKQYLAAGTGSDGIELRNAAYYVRQGINLLRGDRALEIDRPWKRVILASGQQLAYDRLVLATGARPRDLPVPGARLRGVLTLRSLGDAEHLRYRLRDARHLVVVGGGFLGLELAAVATAAGVDVTVVESADRVLPRSVSGPVSRYLGALHRRHGVTVRTGRDVTALYGDSAGQVEAVELNDGSRLPADLVVTSIGVLPDSSLAADAGLAVGDGVLVNGQLRTSDPAIYAIGDCARFPSPLLDRHLRLESVPNASGHARHVAAAILGRAEPYSSVPWFWTEQYEARLSIAGITGGHDRTVVLGDPEAHRFTVLCFRADRLIGAESVNRPADHLAVRRLLAEGTCGLSPQQAGSPGFDLKTALTGSARRPEQREHQQA